MKITENYNDIFFDIIFEDTDKTCIFLSPSGTGKTFLFNVLLEHLKENGVNIILVNSTMLSSLGNNITSIEKICLEDNVEVVILDNADIYLTQEFLDKLVSSNKLTIISLKDVNRFSFKDFGFYRVKYLDNTLNVRRKL